MTEPTVVVRIPEEIPEQAKLVAVLQHRPWQQVLREAVDRYIDAWRPL